MYIYVYVLLLFDLNKDETEINKKFLKGLFIA